MSNWTNLNSIIQFDTYEFERILKKLGKTEPDDEPLHVLSILEECDYWYALYSLNTIKNYDGIADFAIKCAESVVKFYTEDLKSRPSPMRFLEKAKNREVSFHCIKEAKKDAGEIFLEYAWCSWENVADSVAYACLSSFYAQRKDAALASKWAYRAAGEAIEAAKKENQEEAEYEKQKQFFKEIFKDGL